jgi:hypothetical protein
MTKIKLSKIEQKVLELASRSPRGTIATVQSDGVVSRDLKAVQSLRFKGLLAQQSSGGHTQWDFCEGRTVLYLVMHDAITDEGRKALKSK